MLGKLVALVATAALLLLAPPTPSSAADDLGGHAHAAAGQPMSGGMACCPDRDGGLPERPSDDCRPGMACHGGAPAVTGPPVAPSVLTPAFVSFRLISDHLLVSRPPDGILRPPRAPASV